MEYGPWPSLIWPRTWETYHECSTKDIHVTVANRMATANVRVGSRAAVGAMSASSQLSCSKQTFERAASHGRLVPEAVTYPI